MTRHSILRWGFVWAGSLFLSHALVYALASVVGRLSEVDDLGLFLEGNGVARYFFSMSLAAVVTGGMAVVRFLPRPPEFDVRQSPRADLLWGYRLAFLWLLIVLIVLSFFTQEASLHARWFSEGGATLIFSIGFVTLEHIMYRGVFLPLLKKKMALFQATVLVSIALLAQQFFFFHPSSWTQYMSLFLQSVFAILLAEKLGFFGAWAFLMVWTGCLHGVIGFPVAGKEVSSIFYLKLSFPHEMLRLSLSATWLPLMGTGLALFFSWLVAPRVNRRLN